MQRNQRLLQVLQDKLLGLHSVLDVAKARCQAEGVVRNNLCILLSREQRN